MARSANELNDPRYNTEHAEDGHHDVPHLGAWIVDQTPGDAGLLYPPERSKFERGVDQADPDQAEHDSVNHRNRLVGSSRSKQRGTADLCGLPAAS
jgi:hypothetical protein